MSDPVKFSAVRAALELVKWDCDVDARVHAARNVYAAVDSDEQMVAAKLEELRIRAVSAEADRDEALTCKDSDEDFDCGVCLACLQAQLEELRAEQRRERDAARVERNEIAAQAAADSEVVDPRPCAKCSGPIHGGDGGAMEEGERIYHIVCHWHVVRATLAKTTEALKATRPLIEDEWCGCDADSPGQIALRLIDGILADHTGQAAHAEWTKMRAVVDAAREVSAITAATSAKSQTQRWNSLQAAVAALDAVPR